MEVEKVRSKVTVELELCGVLFVDIKVFEQMLVEKGVT